MSLLWFEYPREAKKDYVSLLGSLRTQITFRNTTACLPVKRRLRNECRNSILFYILYVTTIDSALVSPTSFHGETSSGVAKCLGPVITYPGLNFNPGSFFFLSKALSRIIFSILFRVSNHQIVGKENFKNLKTKFAF